MSRRGNCYDNAVMEAFFSTVKTELADRFESCGDAKMELFDYIEVFYNQRRRHSTIGLRQSCRIRARSERSSAVQLEGVLVGTHAPAPTFLAQADERLHAVLSPLTKIQATMN